MAERRPLTEGLKPPPPMADPQREKEFVFGGKITKEQPPSSPKPASLNRVPISTRIRGDLAAALKRCSLERQLQGVEPNTLQDILEQAIEPWLRSNGHLS